MHVRNHAPESSRTFLKLVSLVENNPGEFFNAMDVDANTAIYIYKRNKRGKCSISIFDSAIKFPVY